MSELRSSTAGREWWSEEAVAGGSLVGIDRDRAVELVPVELVPEPECKMSRNKNPGFSMETFMKMLAEMEENRDRRRAEEREIERKRELDRERKRAKEREIERERELERERKRAEEREAERERELERERRSKEREDRLVEQLQAQLEVANGGARREAEPVRANIPTLPRLGPDSSLETFLTTFETQLKGSGVPEDTWKYHFIGQLDDTHRAKLTDCMGEDEFTYGDLVERLGRLDSETAVSAAECYFTSEVDSTRIRNMAEALDVAIKWLNKIIEGVEDRQEIVKILGRASVRTWFTAQLKDYIDQRDVNSNGDLVARVSQWQALKGDERPIFAKKEARKQHTYSAGGLPKKGVVCFECGKTGHVARDCKKGGATGAVNKGDKPDLKGVKCFECGELGHKSPSCPKRKGKATKRVSTRRRKTEVLADNELLGRVNGYWFPMTLDTGASVSLIPREFLGEDAFTGRTEHLRGFAKNAPTIEAPIARVELEIEGRRVTREVAVVDGETLGWEGVFSSRLGSREELNLLLEFQKAREALSEDQAKYVPPRLCRGGKVLGAVPWEEPPPVELRPVEPIPVLLDSVHQSTEDTGTDEPQSQDTGVTPVPAAEEPVNQGGVVVEEEDVGSVVDDLALDEGASAKVEAEGVLEDGAGRTEGVQRNGTRADLVNATMEDSTLAVLRKLADREASGYQWEEGLLMKHQIDEVGQPRKRLCLPQPFRRRAIELAHDRGQKIG